MALSDNLIELFRLINESGESGHLFSDDAVQILNQYSEYLEVKERVSAYTGNSDAVMLLTLRTLAKFQYLSEQIRSDAELVVTFPGLDLVESRYTPQVIREMIHNAEKEILIAGFAISAHGRLPELLLESKKTVDKIIIICSEWRSPAGNNAADLFLSAWPSGRAKPDIYQYEDTSGESVMHIKCLLVDGAELLLGSANFTYAGMNRNFEMGIRIRGAITQTARRLFFGFLNSGKFTKVT